MNTTRTRSTWWRFPVFLLSLLAFLVACLWALDVLRSEPEPDPEGIVQAAEAFSLARQVDEANSLPVRQELAKAIEDGKLTFAEHRRVARLAAAAINERNIAEAMAALDSVAKGYSE